ncbi:hypothetical protein PsorP6_012323 [Peronosclerospora sorghi]|uniref:Uncharacterized protein n=1 Tax=Peronosclerospora sorghi TaxID=230839 RepID=A0ACC0WHU1_9STRA|nr:hypothetical protein PsorP6_012323 [Peronosclerospora sorghi]
MAAEKVCNDLKIISQNDKDKLAKAKELVNLKGFYEGVLIVGSQKGQKDNAIPYWEPESLVISCSGDECVVAHLDQWYLTYDAEEWKKRVMDHISNPKLFDAYNPVALGEYKSTLGWLNKWEPCRESGLGEFVVESLTDSTIYMAYYTIAHHLQSNLDGSKLGPHGIKLKQMTKEAFPPTESTIPLDVLKQIHDEFEYWYPVDVRASGKDLIRKHLTMCLYNHVAIWRDDPSNSREMRLEILSKTTAAPSEDYVPYSGNSPLSVPKSELGWESEMNFMQVETPSQVRQRFIQIQVTDRRFKEPSWMNPNIGGGAQYVQGKIDEIAALSEELQINAKKNKLGEWTSTSISGNDILSSVLFSTGQTIAKAGCLAPVSQLFVVTLVYCLRWVFEEVMSAVPLNGGFYTAMLNSAPKKVAAVCAVFSILSYLSTAVVNGVSAMNYVNESLVEIPVMVCTIGLLAAFAGLCLLGIAESAFVALVFFVFHSFTLTLLGIFCVVHFVQHPSIFYDNMSSSLPEVTMYGRNAEVNNVASALFLGYGTAVLGVTGFESSSQYVEEQAVGMFPKTLRNMWVLSSIFNSAYSLLALAVVPLETIILNQSTLLSYMGRLSGGRWLEILVAIDAFGVLAGAVLTAYVGINGLFQRLTVDRILPSFLLKTNSCRGTNHFIIVTFFVVAASLVFILNADVTVLSGVFALAFLCVLLSFIIACLLLKLNREEIPRKRTTSWINTGFCLCMVALGILANAFSDVKALSYFVIYFAVFFSVVFLMLNRVSLLKALLFVSGKLHVYFQRDSLPSQLPFGGSVKIAKTIEKIKNTPVVFFCKSTNLPNTNEAISYVMANEHTYCLRLVHVCELNAPVPREFEHVVNLFDHIYPSIKIDFIAVTGVFDPAMVQWLSMSMNIPTNMMFMRQPASENIHRVMGLGVRVITKS